MAVQVRSLQVNAAYIPYLDNDTRVQIFFGGSSSGKSHFVAQRAVMDVLRGRNYLVCRDVARTLRQSVYNQLVKTIDAMGLRERFVVTKSEMTITCKQNGRQILFAGLDDVEKLKSITPAVGVLTDVWIEEATEVGYEAYKQLTKRLRGTETLDNRHETLAATTPAPATPEGELLSLSGHETLAATEPAPATPGGEQRTLSVPLSGKRITFSFNPILKEHWIYKEFFGGWDEGRVAHREAGLSILKTTYRDNFFLTADDRAALEDESDPYFYNVYTLGNWGVLGKVVYTNWRVADLSAEMGRFDNIYNGLDFGFANPCALVRCHVDRKNRRIYVFDEEYRAALFDEQLAALLLDKLGAQYVACDCNNPQSVAKLQALGVRAIPAVKGADSVVAGINFLRGFEIVVHTGCRQFRNEIASYKWAEDKFGNALERPVKRDDHLMDALRYAVEEVRFAAEGEARRV